VARLESVREGPAHAQVADRLTQARTDFRAMIASDLNVPGALGYPFRAVVDYGDYTYTWCKTEQVPGEMLVLAPDAALGFDELERWLRVQTDVMNTHPRNDRG